MRGVSGIFEVSSGRARRLCGRARWVALLVVAAAGLVRPAAAGASTVVQLTGGKTPGFGANGEPLGITTGPDGHIWFTQHANPGDISRVNSDGTVTEFIGGDTPGFTANTQPDQITTGPDGHIWFTETCGPYSPGAPHGCAGAVARLNSDGTVTEFVGGVTAGFSSGGQPTGLTTGPDGNIWFTEPNMGVGDCGNDFAGCGGLARVNGDGTISEFEAGHNLPGLTPFALESGLWGAGLNQITAGSDGNIWFTEPTLQNSHGTSVGGVGRLNLGFANVTEFPADTTPGFSTQAQPWSITSGTGGHVWFTELAQLGGVAYVNGDATIHEYGPPATPGFTSGMHPNGITLGNDGNMWFTESVDPGAVARVNPDGSVSEFRGGSTSGFSANGHPNGITMGPDRVWFTEGADPGRVAYINAPQVSAVNPNAGTVGGGNTVVIHGQAFSQPATVSFGASQASNVTVLSDSELRAVAPAHGAGVVSVTVSTPSGSIPGGNGSLYAYGPPTVGSFTPTSGITGRAVTINGSGFVPGATVSFGVKSSPSVAFISTGQLRAIVPNGATAGKLSVTTGAGTGTSAASFTPRTPPPTRSPVPSSRPRRATATPPGTASSAREASSAVFTNSPEYQGYKKAILELNDKFPAKSNFIRFDPLPYKWDGN